MESEQYEQIMKRFDEGEKRFDKQDRLIEDIRDQVKGNDERDIEGIRPRQMKMQIQLEEHQNILILPMAVSKIPKGWLILIAIIMAEGLLEVAHAGLITGLISLAK